MCLQQTNSFQDISRRSEGCLMLRLRDDREWVREEGGRRGRKTRREESRGQPYMLTRGMDP